MGNEITLSAILLDEALAEINAARREMENAVDAILTVAEKVMERTDGNIDTEDAMTIIESCAFQDITGQRLSKAVKKIDQARATNEIKQATGIIARLNESDKADEDANDEAGLLNGPALPGAGLDQDAVNKLLAEAGKK